MIKKCIIISMIVLLIVLLFCACKGEKSSTKVTAKMSVIYENIMKDVDMPPMNEIEYEYFSNCYITKDFDDSVITDYVLYEAEDSLLVDTVIIINVNKNESNNKVKSVLENVKNQKMSANADGYNPVQYNIASKGIIKEKDSVIYLIISEKQNEIEKVINSYLK